MNKFNLNMSILIVITIIFFGVGIFQKANYKVATGDTVSIAYSIIDGDDTYDSQSATVVIGSNKDKIFTDKMLTGLKYGADLDFDTKLKAPVKIDDQTTIKKGTKVTIDGKLSDVTPKAPETNSEASSETK